MYGAPEYGVPTATFKINGTVTNETNKKVQGIRVVLLENRSYTNDEGKYNVQTESYAGDQSFQVKFEDVDGTQNGELQSMDTTLAFTRPKYENGNGE